MVIIDAIHMTNIRDKDLNLLRVFLIIGEEQNLSKASVRLGLSQPALSHSLGKLREQFADALFVRSQRGLVPTPKTISLLPRVRIVLESAAELYGFEEDFRLESLQRRVVIASTTYFEARAMGEIMKRLANEAPKVRLETQSLVSGFPKQELENSQFDLAVAAYFENIPSGFRIRTIYKDRFVCIGSPRTVFAKSKGKLADYLSQQHLQIEVPPGVFAPVDQYLKVKGKQRNIVVRIGNFLTPASVLRRTDLLLTCPLSLAQQYEREGELKIYELPFRLPEITTKMCWHERFQRDPFHRWLRDIVAGDVRGTI
jgi:DNA-binding transcriptional LysR family regulator